jgi:hypothetical protein
MSVIGYHTPQECLEAHRAQDKPNVPLAQDGCSTRRLPVRRFVTRLKELIESGLGLLDQEIMAEQAST